MSAHEIYVANAELIDRVIRTVCRRHQLFGADSEDFAGEVRLRLLENDSAVLKAFQNRSTFSTYLVVVITHCFDDWRIRRWGKWRPSAEARRLGKLAVQLETLTVRDGLSLDEAYELLRTNYGIQETREEIEHLASRFPSRPRRVFVGEEAIEGVTAIDADAEAPLRRRESAATVRAAGQALDVAMADLAPEDTIIFRMRYADGCSVAEIARSLSLDQRPLYRRIERLRSDLRKRLVSAGIDPGMAATALEQGGLDE